MIAYDPPMGWNSWDCYGAAVDEKTVKQNADFMSKHLKQFGWEYIVVDIQWYQPSASTHMYEPFADLEMDEYARLLPAVNRFPSAAGGKGFAPLAEYVHSLGLKFGIHMMRGIPRQAVVKNTKIMGSEYSARQVAVYNDICCWNPDMYGTDTDCPGAADYYNSLFALYAGWGVDFVKVDDICRNDNNEGEIKLIADAIKNSGREMVLSLSPAPQSFRRRNFSRNMPICGALPMISGTSGSFYTICLSAPRFGAIMPAQDIGLMLICFLSARSIRSILRTTAPSLPKTSSKQ